MKQLSLTSKQIDTLQGELMRRRIDTEEKLAKGANLSDGYTLELARKLQDLQALIDHVYNPKSYTEEG